MNKNKNFKCRFSFGTKIKYHNYLVRMKGKEFNYNYIWKRTIDKEREGTVIGWKYLSNGRYEAGEGYRYTAKESIFVLEIKRGMLNKTDYVLPIDVKKEIWNSLTIPERIVSFTEKDRRILRNIMKTVPRDEKGRWIK